MNGIRIIQKLNTMESKEIKWYKTLDLNDEHLCDLMSIMFGSLEQRINQLYIIRNNQNFKLKHNG